jgi:hypothetical protein
LGSYQFSLEPAPVKLFLEKAGLVQIGCRNKIC